MTTASAPRSRESRRPLAPRWLIEWLLPALCFAGIAAKLLILGEAVDTGDFPAHRARASATVSLLAFAALPALASAGHVRLWIALGMNAAATTIALGDLWHVRFYGDLLTVSEAGLIAQLPAISSSLVALIQPADLLSLVDLAAVAGLGFVLRARPRERPRRRPRLTLLVAVLVGAATAIPAWRLVARDPEDVFEYQFRRQEVASALGLAGYHVYDLGVHLRFHVRGRLTVGEASIAAAADLIHRSRERASSSTLSGIARGRNVIILSAESLEAFAVDLAVDGQPVAPNFSRFARESLRFTEFYDQTHQDTTSGAEFLALNSLLPLTASAVATRYPANDFRTLIHVLRDHGYGSLSACGEPGSFWNMRQIHRKYGFEQSVFLEDLPKGEWIGVGMDDISFYEQIAPRLAALPQPFVAFLLSSSNHHPFELPARLRELHPAPLPGTREGNYLQSVRYADTAFGLFVEALGRAGLLDRSIVVVYGDHRIFDVELDSFWMLAGHREPPTQLERWRLERRVPLFIRLPGGAAAGERDAPGGQIDIAPTLLSLLGIDDGHAPWLGRDLTAPGSAPVVFREGSATNVVATALRTPTGTTCIDNRSRPLDCDLLEPMMADASARLAASDAIIGANAVFDVRARLARHDARPPRASDRVLVIAHRGNSRQYPENTLPAILSAFDAGADLVEVDVRLSRDGVPVLFHDETLERTTDGIGRPEDLMLRQLKRLDAGGWLKPSFAGTRIATLEEALQATRGRGSLYLDITGDGLAEPIAAVFTRLSIPPREATIATWTPAQRDSFARAMPGARLVFLGALPPVWDGELFADLRRAGVWGVELGDEWPPALIGAARDHQFPVFAYTTNDEPTMRRLIEAGIAGIETDDPALLARVAGSAGKRER